MRVNGGLGSGRRGGALARQISRRLREASNERPCARYGGFQVRMDSGDVRNKVSGTDGQDPLTREPRLARRTKSVCL